MPEEKSQNDILIEKMTELVERMDKLLSAKETKEEPKEQEIDEDD